MNKVPFSSTMFLQFFALFFADRHSHDTVEVQKEEEKKFKEVGEAYAVLSDQKKRTRYDNGHDLEDLDGGGFGEYNTGIKHGFSCINIRQVPGRC